MADLTPSLNNVPGQAERTVRKAGPWIEKLARAGYAAKGIVYIIVGVLAVQAAFTGGGKTTNSQGALVTIVEQPFGQLLLGVVGIVLAGYALWCFVDAAIDAENKGNDTKGVAKRLGYVVSGIAYGVLAFTAFELIIGHANSNGNSGRQDWTARLLEMPFGQWLVAFIGLAVIGVGLAQIIKGYKADFSKEQELDSIPPAYRNKAVISGRWGYIACGVVYAIVGGFLVEAALHSNPRQAKGVGSALDLLAQQPYGPWLLGIVALGLVSFGIFMLVEARYKRIAI